MGRHDDSQMPQATGTGTASDVVVANPCVAVEPLSPVFYDATQRRRIWFFGLSTLFTTMASFVLAGFIVSVHTPPAFAAEQLSTLPSMASISAGTPSSAAAYEATGARLMRAAFLAQNAPTARTVRLVAFGRRHDVRKQV